MEDLASFDEDLSDCLYKLPTENLPLVGLLLKYRLSLFLSSTSSFTQLFIFSIALLLQFGLIYSWRKLQRR